MREIKFKAKNINFLWVVGDLSVVKNKSAGVDPGYYISNSAGMPFAFRVIGESIGQYTGLKDINGVEIYEGDIVHRKTHLVLYGSDLDVMVDNYYLVEWKYGGWHIGEDLIDLVSEAGINGQTLCEETALQVVGNIHENPELLQNNGVIE